MIDNLEILSYPLTKYSHGAGCGCKISPSTLNTILKKNKAEKIISNLIVGNEDRDDAAVVDTGDGQGIISTTDFFMPIVDDPVAFGRIASVNAISDVYAMGGTPLVAIAILGWPIDKIPPEIANAVMDGGRLACAEAGIALAGGHSIDSPEPIFGLAVTGRIQLKHLKRNSGAKSGDKLFLTKGLGVGIYSTAQKKKVLLSQDKDIAKDSMLVLNKVGEDFGKLPYVNAMTDVTGFGLLGHLSEMCHASNTSASIVFEKVPLLEKERVNYYLGQHCVPGGTKRNWASYGHLINSINDYQKQILCDPQTSGGLLVAVDSEKEEAFLKFIEQKGLSLQSIGQMTSPKERLIDIL